MTGIVRADAGDAARLAALHQVIFAHGWAEDEFERLLALSGALGLISVLDGNDNGFLLASLTEGEAEVLTIGVRPAWQGKGVGRALMTSLLNELNHRETPVCFLEVAETNLAARALYEGLGFRQIGQRRRYYSDGSDALCLRWSGPAG